MTESYQETFFNWIWNLCYLILTKIFVILHWQWSIIIELKNGFKLNIEFSESSTFLEIMHM